MGINYSKIITNHSSQIVSAEFLQHYHGQKYLPKIQREYSAQSTPQELSMGPQLLG